MIIRISLIAFCAVFVLQPAKSQKIDPLKALLQGTTDLERVDILYELSCNYIEVDNILALKYGLEGYNISTKFNDSLRIVRAGLVTASPLRRLQRIDSSIVVYNCILQISEKNNYAYELQFILNSYAIALINKAEYDKALNYLFRSPNLSELAKYTASSSFFHKKIPVPAS